MIDRRAFLGRTMLAGVAIGLGSAARAARPEAMPLDAFSAFRSGLDHPEGIAATPDGRIFLSNGGGAIGVVERDGSLRQVGTALSPNGVAIDPQGRAIVANMGLLKKLPGPLQRIDVASGKVETLVDRLEGRELTSSNGPTVARDGTIYCTHSKWDKIAAIGSTTPDGFIYMVRPDGGASIVARGLAGVNGLCLDRRERFLYASLTPFGIIRRWPRRRDGTLGKREDFGPKLGAVVAEQTVQQILAMPTAERAGLGYCDGIAFDAVDNLWVTLPFANKLVAITPQRELVEIVHDPEATIISMPTNLCWGGSDLRDLYVVSRRSGVIARARTAVAGAPLANWPVQRPILSEIARNGGRFC